MQCLTIDEAIKQFDLFLIDAAGVLYAPFDGVIEGASKAIKEIQSHGKDIFIVTNNTSLSPKEIQQQFERYDIWLDLDAIISSGLGLFYDRTLHQKCKHKKFYVYGDISASYYIDKAGGIVTQEIEEAHGVIMVSSVANNEYEYEKVYNFLKKKPTIPVICTNPDRYVSTKKGLYPVIGYYAEKMERQLQRDFDWIGKPYENFSKVVATIIHEKGPYDLRKACFFDDNIDNVIQLKKDLNLKGCFISETGIMKMDDVNEKKGAIDFFMKQFSS